MPHQNNQSHGSLAALLPMPGIPRLQLGRRWGRGTTSTCGTKAAGFVPLPTSCHFQHAGWKLRHVRGVAKTDIRTPADLSSVTSGCTVPYM
jgi:hypothetical protein